MMVTHFFPLSCKTVILGEQHGYYTTAVPGNPTSAHRRGEVAGNCGKIIEKLVRRDNC